MKQIDVTDLPDTTREIVRECQITGRRTAFTHNGANVAVLVTWDEYLALRETIDISRDETLRGRIETAGRAIRGNDMLLIDDLIADI